VPVTSSPQTIDHTEVALERAVAYGTSQFCPPRLAAALRYVVFPAGGRVRPTLCLAVAEACANAIPPLAAEAAASIELLHCASLVHDDLPCFDNADHRRGRPSLHRAFGEELAVLTGDALIVMAFNNMALASGPAELIVRVMHEIAQGAGPAAGVTAGQAWESEPQVEPVVYRRLKTGALFEAAAVCGAIVAGADGESWRPVGACIGEAYQIADDLADHLGTAETGKDASRDADLNRPTSLRELGADKAVERLMALVDEACGHIPAGASGRRVEDTLRRAGARLLPPRLRV
jgi:geranylgeranyl diphosphate synthase type II